jgi:hypothetical protein
MEIRSIPAVVLPQDNKVKNSQSKTEEEVDSLALSSASDPYDLDVRVKEESNLSPFTTPPKTATLCSACCPTCQWTCDRGAC